MTIHQRHKRSAEQNNPEAPLPKNQPLIPKPTSLSSNNPLIYLLIVFWVLFRPDLLRAYRIRLDVPGRQLLRQQAARLVVTLAWAPLLAWALLIWTLQLAPVNGWLLGGSMGLTAVVWTISHKSATVQSRNHDVKMLPAAILSTFILIATITYTIYIGGEKGAIVAMLAVAALLFDLCGLCVAMLFRWRTLEIISGITALFLVGALTIIMINTMTHFWIPILIVLGAVIWVGVTEERYDIANHQQGHNSKF